MGASSDVVDAELEMQVRASRSSGVAAVGDVLAGCDSVTFGDVGGAVMAVRVAQAVGALDRDADATGGTVGGWVAAAAAG